MNAVVQRQRDKRREESKDKGLQMRQAYCVNELLNFKSPLCLHKGLLKKKKLLGLSTEFCKRNRSHPMYLCPQENECHHYITIDVIYQQLLMDFLDQI